MILLIPPKKFDYHARMNKKNESDYCEFVSIQPSTCRSGLMAIFVYSATLEQTGGMIDRQGNFEPFCADRIESDKLAKRKQRLEKQGIAPTETDKAIRAAEAFTPREA